MFEWGLCIPHWSSTRSLCLLDDGLVGLHNPSSTVALLGAIGGLVVLLIGLFGGLVLNIVEASFNISLSFKWVWAPRMDWAVPVLGSFNVNWFCNIFGSILALQLCWDTAPGTWGFLSEWFIFVSLSFALFVVSWRTVTYAFLLLTKLLLKLIDLGL